MEILSTTSRWLGLQQVKRSVQVEIHVARGDALQLFGDTQAAGIEYEAALAINPSAHRAHLGLARVRMPGLGYIGYLTRIHKRFQPRSYLELGIGNGATLTLARPPTIAVGVDPVPKLMSEPTAETRIYPMTSDAFFETKDVAAEFDGQRVDLAFIDGHHQLETALRDFINVERWSNPQGLVAIHDTMPLDERVQSRDRASTFWTGDVWKVALALIENRPDLDVFTVPAFPAGLTLVARLDPTSTVLADRYDEIVSRSAEQSFAAIQQDFNRTLNVVPNDWQQVSARLAAGRKSG
jgi:hypothetical protein